MSKSPSTVYCNTSSNRAKALERIVRDSYNILRATSTSEYVDLLTSYTSEDRPITILERDLTATNAVLDRFCKDFGYFRDGMMNQWKHGFLHTPHIQDGAFVGHGHLRSHSGRAPIQVQTRIKSVSSIGRKVYFEHGRDVFDSTSYIQKYGTTFEHGHEIEFPVASDDEFVLHGGGRCAIEDVHGIKLIFDSLKDLERTRDRLYNGTSNLQVYRVKDYISNPKRNGYQSLHMVLGAKNNGRKVFADVHMETNEMWHNNEHGQGVSREEYMQRRIDSAYLHKYGDCVVVTHQGLDNDALRHAPKVLPRVFRLSPDGTYGIRCASQLMAFCDEVGEKVVLDPTPMQLFHMWYSIMGPNISPEMYHAGERWVRDHIEETTGLESMDYIWKDVKFDGKNVEYIYDGVNGSGIRFNDFKGVLPTGAELPVMHINLVKNK